MVAQENGNAVAGEMAGLSVGPGALVPVGQARTVLPKPDLSSVPAVETQTQAIGLITPPPDIKAIVDKTATFVAKNGKKLQLQMHWYSSRQGTYTGIVQKQAEPGTHAGAQFEQQILKQQQNSTKFSFLREGDPYNAYYKYKVQHVLSALGMICQQRAESETPAYAQVSEQQLHGSNATAAATAEQQAAQAAISAEDCHRAPNLCHACSFKAAGETTSCQSIGTTCRPHLQG